MEKYYRRIRLFISLLGRLDAYVECEELSTWDIIYKRRLGFKSAWSLACDIHN